MQFLYDDAPTIGTAASRSDAVSFSDQLAEFARAEVGLAAAVLRPGDAGFKLGQEIIRPEFGELFTAAERQTRLVDQAFSRDQATEEAYDRRIKAVENATGVRLENPMRQRLSERELRRLNRDGPIDPNQHLRDQFDLAVDNLRSENPDKADALTFGDIRKEAGAISKGAEDEYAKVSRETPLSTPSALTAQFAGGLWGSRRDPLFVGSLFFGPTSAVGRTVAARIASSALFQGLYNAGLQALAQPSVQAWREEIGVRSGIVPAVENVGMAFLSGVIPGAILRGAHEALLQPGKRAMREALQRFMDGVPEAGDIKAAVRAVRPDITPQELAGIRAAEAASEADALTAPKATGAPEPLHDDLTAAALRSADDPLGSPSPAGVAAVTDLERAPPEIQARVAAAQPRTLREAQMAASEAIEDIGNRQAIAATRAQMEADRLPAPPPPEPGAIPPPARSKDPLDKVPIAREVGGKEVHDLVSPRQIENIAGEHWHKGEREGWYADIIRECK